jgi:hypothetical protein
MAKIYDILEVAGLEPLAAAPTPAFKGRAYYDTILGYPRVYGNTGWEQMGGGGGGGGSSWIVTGTFIAPIAITAGGGITPSGAPLQLIYIAGSGGPVDVTAVPQIAAGNAEGDCLELIGTSNVNTVLLEDVTGLALNGAWLAQAGSVLGLRWDATSALWRERYRS